VERGEWESESDYPRAPLPAHERTWRHPSEVGRENWVQTEPTLVVGRGLSVATGTIGAILAVGLLWLMIPRHNEGGVAVEESTTSARTQSSPPLSREASSAPPSLQGSSGTAATSAPAAATTTSIQPTSPTSVAASALSSTTQLVSRPVPTLVIDRGGVEEAVPAIAVSLRTGHYIVTTAAAVDGRSDLSVQLPSGETVTGTVVSVDAASGAAVLVVDMEIENSSFEPSALTVSAEGTIVATPDGEAVRLWADETGTQISYQSGSVPGEGVPVIDADGRLMGLCTQNSSGVHLVGVNALMTALEGAEAAEGIATTTTTGTSTTGTAGSATSTTMVASSPPNPALSRLGVRLQVTDTGAVMVTEVSVGGPAALAGIQIGDVVTAVDGKTTTDIAGLGSAVSAHAIGDTVIITVLHLGATAATDVAVTLTEKPF
jgi:S1-C subfamily serine protease